MAAKIRLKAKERLSLFKDLSTMLGAGISILEAVEALEMDSKGSQQQVLAKLRASLNNGQSLSHAMERLPDAFDTVTVNLVKAAEAGGTLETTLQDIVATTQKEIIFGDQLRTTMIYPLFVMIVFTGIVLLMLTFVIPRVSKVFSTLPVHLSAVTKVLFSASSFFLNHWPVVVGGIIMLVLLFAYVIAHNKRALSRFILSLPMLNTLGRNIDFTRFTRSFGQLMHAGVPIDEALALSFHVVQKKQIVAIVRMMQANMQSGKPLSAGLRDTNGIVPPIMSRSIETAEKSGTLDQTLQTLTEYFDGEVNNSLKVIGSLVEPVLLVVVGVLVGTLMITIIGPVYGLISQINAKG